MAFKLSIINAPTGTAYWNATCGTAMSPDLTPSASWYYAETAPAGTVNIYLYNSSGSQTDAFRNLWMTPEGYEVVFDCITQIWTKLPLSSPPPPPLPDAQFRNLAINSISPGSISAGNYNATPITVNFSVEHYGKSKSVVGIFARIEKDGTSINSSSINYTFSEDSNWRTYNLSITVNMPANPSPGTYNVRVAGIDSLEALRTSAISVSVPSTQFTNLNIPTIYPLKVKAGQAITLWWQFTHTGIAETVTLYASMGKVIAGVYDEKVSNQISVQLGNDYSPLTYSGQIAFVCPTVSAGMYSVEIKINGLFPRARLRVDDVIEVYEEAAPPSPPTPTYSGQISTISPDSIKVGDPLKIVVSYWARTTSATDYITGWQTKLDVSLNGFSKLETNTHLGSETTRVQEINLGTMPNKNLSGRVILYAGGVQVDKKDFTIKAVTTAPPTEYTCPYCGQKFSTQAELEQHIASVHGAKPPSKPSNLAMAALIGVAILALGTKEEEKHGAK